jgi:spore coat protein A
VTVTWRHRLPAQHHLTVDTCPHGPDVFGSETRVSVHFHGGHVPARFDGHPDYTIGAGQQLVFTYPNTQRASTLWYHDHAVGITRLNVMMGLAGFYILRDPAEDAAVALPSGEFDVALAIMDKTTDQTGALQYPAAWQKAGFSGQALVVNGKVAPWTSVKRGKYRLRLLNGCEQQYLTLSFAVVDCRLRFQSGLQYM